MNRVVVGVDGSTGSHEAVAFAAAEARARGVPLDLVHGYASLVLAVPLMPLPYPPDVTHLAERDRAVDEEIAALAENVRALHPDLTVHHRVVSGPPAGVLVAESRTADVVVVGARGHGGFAELLVGSVATQVATHAHCPVVVVRQPSADGGPVVVGVDASPQARLAVAFAFEAAAWRGVSVRAVYVGSDQGIEHPGVPVTGSVVDEDGLLGALVDASAGASLVVVGSRGRGAFTSLLLGSVSYTLAHHAHCPVAITRAPAAH